MLIYIYIYFIYTYIYVSDSSAEENITARFEKPYLKRDEGLRNLHKGLKAEEKENKHSVQKLRSQYSRHHGDLINQKKLVKKQNNIQRKEKKEKEVRTRSIFFFVFSFHFR